MKNLAQVVKLVTKRRLKKIELLNDVVSSGKGNKYYELYTGIRENKIKTDEDAAHYLYKTNAKDKKYLMLKGRFKRKILNSLFFLDDSKLTLSEYDLSYQNLNKKVLLIKLLRINGISALMRKLSKEVLKKARYYQFNDIIVQVTDILRHDCSQRGDRTMYKEYDKILNRSIKTYELELKSEDYYDRILINFRKSVATKPELIPRAKSYVAELRKHVTKYPSYVIQLNLFRLWYLSYQMQQEYQQTIEICTKAEEYLELNPRFKQNTKVVELALTKLECFSRLRDDKNGLNYAEKCLNYFASNSYNRLVLYEYYFLLTMATGKYLSAFEIYKKASEHPLFKSAPLRKQEKWKIFAAYLYYVSNHMEVIKFENPDFRLAKFLNEVPIYSKDKSGYNVSILILQLIFLLERGDFSGIIDRMDALKIYRSRYLRSAGDFRSNTFIKMLLVMEKKDFEFEKTKRIAKKYLLSMQKVGEQKGGGLSDLEVIPYEDLWERVLRTLQRDKSK